MVSFEDLCNEIGRRVDAYAVIVYRNDNRKKLADQYQMWTGDRVRVDGAPRHVVEGLLREAIRYLNDWSSDELE